MGAWSSSRSSGLMLLASDDDDDDFNFDGPDQDTDQAGGADADDDLGAEDAADADEDEDGVGDDDNECYSRKDKKLWLQGVLVCWTADTASSDRYPIADLKHGKSKELAGRSMYALYRDLTPRALAVPARTFRIAFDEKFGGPDRPLRSS